VHKSASAIMTSSVQVHRHISDAETSLKQKSADS